MNAERTTEPTTAEERAAWASPYQKLPNSATKQAVLWKYRTRRVLDDYATLAATNRALTEALSRIADTPREGEAMEGHELRHERSSAAVYAMLDSLIVQARALLSGQPVQARDTEHGALEAMAADVRSLSTQLGQKIEQAVERDGELERLREALDTVYETFRKDCNGLPIEYMAAVVEHVGQLIGKGEYAGWPALLAEARDGD
jgi:hypothetical protein